MTTFQLLDLYILLLNNFTSKYSKFLLEYLAFKSYFDFSKMIFFGIVFCLLLLLEVCKNHHRKENTSVEQARQIYTLLSSFKRNFAKRIYVTLGVYEFRNIHIFNWYKALYPVSSSTFWHLHFIRAVHQLRTTSPMVYS